MTSELAMLLLPLCFLAVAFFAGIETGVLSINHARLMHLVRAGSKAALLLNRYASDMQRFLATTLVGSNMMNVVLSTLSAGLAQACFPQHQVAQAVWGTVMACMVVCFSEYLPKLFFTTRPLRRSLLVVRAFYVFEKLLWPVTSLVLFLTKWLVPQGHNAPEHPFLMTREFILNVVSDPKDGARITAFERLMINRVLDLQTQTAAQVMTPINRVTRTTERALLSNCYQLIRDSGHVRLPVFSEDGERCVGVLNTLDVLASKAATEQEPVCVYMGKPFFVNDSVRADDLLPLMRKSHQPMVIVRSGADGVVRGVITEENILHALTGSLK